MATETRPMFDTEELVINMGPQHPSTHGVPRVVLRLDGEKVVSSEVVIGYLHRGIEKLSENRNWTRDHPADGPDGLRGRRDQQRRLLPDGRKADADRGAAPRALRADGALRAFRRFVRRRTRLPVRVVASQCTLAGYEHSVESQIVLR